MLCEQVVDRESLLTVAERVIDALEPPFFLEGKEFHSRSEHRSCCHRGRQCDSGRVAQ